MMLWGSAWSTRCGTCCSVGVPRGSAAAAESRVVFRAPGIRSAPPLWLWALCSLDCFPDVSAQSHAFCSVAFKAVGCCVLLCCRHPGAHWVLPAIASCFGPCSCTFRSVLSVRSRRTALCFGVCHLEFPAVCCAVTPTPTIVSLRKIHSGALFLFFSGPCSCVSIFRL